MLQSINQDNPEILRDEIKRHEGNLKLLRLQAHSLDESILGLQLNFVRHQTNSGPNAASKKNCNGFHGEKQTTDQILQHRESAAGVLCRLTTNHAFQASNLPVSKDVLGIVASLASVNNYNLSQCLSEYLGLETMLGIVCKTREGVKALEYYDDEGKINGNIGIHGLGSSIGRKIAGRYLVICLEDLRQEYIIGTVYPYCLLLFTCAVTIYLLVVRPFAGDILASDSQRKLAIPKPTLPNGTCPPGFLDFAVNMINLEIPNLSYVTAGGYGLRETLFYKLFSSLQVYRSRTEMLNAHPCITHGAVSLDGGIIKKNGVFALGNRRDIQVNFPHISGGSKLASEHSQIEDTIRILKLEQQNAAGDIRREQALLEKLKARLLQRRQA